MADVSEARPARATPASLVRFGTILFLASELLLFGGLFAAYFGLRSLATSWPPDGFEPEWPLALGGTALLIVVGVALETIGQPEARLVTREYEGFGEGTRVRGGIGR